MNQVILLVRHGQTDYHPDRLAGWTPDVHLGRKGRRQAKSVAERLAPVKLVALYSSPLERCLETAGAIADGRRLDVRVDEDLGEVRFGSWQGRPYKVLIKTKLWRTVQLVPSQARFPNGETFRELQRRGVEALERIRAAHPKGVIGVVSHADMIKIVAAHYLGMPLDMFQRIVIGTASVTAVGFGEGFPRVLRLGDTGTYEEFAPSRRGKAR